jgi:hypothetical protein
MNQGNYEMRENHERRHLSMTPGTCSGSPQTFVPFVHFVVALFPP